jgi:hypothetical protein
MRAPHHHNGAGLFLATVLVLLGGAGVVSAQQGPSRPAEVAPAPVIEDPVAEHVRIGRPTVAPPTTTTLPPTTTTTTTVAATVPPTTPTAAAPRRVTTTTAAPVAVPPPPDGPAYAMGLVREVIPARWLAVLPVSVEVIAGTTSWSSWDGLIQIGDWHLFHAVDRAKNTLAHEWGHQVAWHYGTDAYNGAPPAGFPYAGPTPQEQWADCVAQALTGTIYPSPGLGACPSAALGFTRQFLDAGPGPRLR